MNLPVLNIDEHGLATLVWTQTLSHRQTYEPLSGL